MSGRLLLSFLFSFLFSTPCFSQDLSRPTLDRLVRSYLPRDAKLVEILELTKTAFDSYDFQAELADVIMGEYWDDEHSFLFVAHDASPKGFTNQRLAFTLFPGRSRNLKPMMHDEIKKVYGVDFSLSCLKEKSCPVKKFNRLMWGFLGRALGFGNRDVYKKAHGMQMKFKVGYDQLFLYTFKIKECPPEACMDEFHVFIKRDGKILGTRTTTVGYRPNW